jgi:hypothetical protein
MAGHHLELASSNILHTLALQTDMPTKTRNDRGQHTLLTFARRIHKHRRAPRWEALKGQITEMFPAGASCLL